MVLSDQPTNGTFWAAVGAAIVGGVSWLLGRGRNKLLSVVPVEDHAMRRSIRGLEADCKRMNAASIRHGESIASLNKRADRDHDRLGKVEDIALRHEVLLTDVLKGGRH